VNLPLIDTEAVPKEAPPSMLEGKEAFPYVCAIGDPIRLSMATFERLSEAFFTELERRFVKS
jgi:hypothetical protein